MSVLDKLDPNAVPKIKLGLHIAQMVLSFVLWCLSIAVFRGKESGINGRNGWTFGVCFLSIPAWVYLVMTPRFERTRKFAQPHAMLTIDALFIIIWLSAFATQAAFNAAGECGKVCNLSGAVVGLGVVITLLFAATSFLSAYTLTYYNFHGVLPGYDSRKIRGGEDIDPDKAAFSMAPHDDEAYERVNMDDHEASGSGAFGSSANGYGDDRYGAGNPYSSGDYDADNRYGSSNSRHNNPMFEADTEYNSNMSHVSNAGSSNPYGRTPGYDEDPTAQFPAADYDRIQR